MNNRMAGFRQMGNRRRVSYFGKTERKCKDDALDAVAVEFEETVKCPDRKSGCNLYNTFECDYERTGICPKCSSEK